MSERNTFNWRERYFATTQWILRYGHWWIDELKGVVEALWERLAPQAATRVIGHVYASGAVLWLRRGRRVSPLGTVNRLPSGAWPDTPSLSEAWAIGTRADIGLLPDQVLVRELTLGLVARADRAGLVQLYLERELPLSLERFYYTHRELPRSHSAEPLACQVQVAHRATIEELVVRLRGWGLKPARVGLAEGTTGVVDNFLPTSRRPWRLDLLKKADRRWAMAAAALAALWVATIGAQWGFERWRVNGIASKTHAAALAVANLADRIERVATPTQEFSRIMATSDAADVLTTLSESVPTDSWAYELSIDAPLHAPSDIKMIGFASSAPSLIDALQRVPQLSEVTLVNQLPDGTQRSRVQLTLRAFVAAPAKTAAMSASQAGAGA